MLDFILHRKWKKNSLCHIYTVKQNFAVQYTKDQDSETTQTSLWSSISNYLKQFHKKNLRFTVQHPLQIKIRKFPSWDTLNNSSPLVEKI